ncbi:MAG TPA: hypothetical protein PKE31_20110 [Pseudomonadota bacterium]|nr:hypothetical protein [Pseudomonadota bacterium]
MQIGLLRSSFMGFFFGVFTLCAGSCNDSGGIGGSELPPGAVCQPGEKKCLGNVLSTCNEVGEYTQTLECSTATVCDAALGCVACTPGANTCVQNEVHSCNPDGTPGALLAQCDFAQTCRGGQCVDSCELAASEFVYLLDSSNQLLSFEPRNDTAPNAVKVIGKISCPTGSSPNSMSVDRRAYAWLNYDDGKLYKIPTNNPSKCVDSGYQRDGAMTAKVGMGFVSDTAGSKIESLYLATFGSTSQLWKLNPLDAAPIKPTKIGNFATSQTSPEMTGTGAAELYAYFPATDANHRIIRVDKTNAQAALTWTIPPLASSPGAWAFAQWGGRYYVFVTENNISRVYRWDPNATGSAQWVRVQDTLATRIVGAGVSTCAPTVVG